MHHRASRARSPASCRRRIRPDCPCPGEERTIDLLDVDLAVLHRLDGAPDLHNAARGFLRIGRRGEVQRISCSSSHAGRGEVGPYISDLLAASFAGEARLDIGNTRICSVCRPAKSGARRDLWHAKGCRARTARTSFKSFFDHVLAHPLSEHVQAALDRARCSFQDKRY